MMSELKNFSVPLLGFAAGMSGNLPESISALDSKSFLVIPWLLFWGQ